MKTKRTKRCLKLVAIGTMLIWTMPALATTETMNGVEWSYTVADGTATVTGVASAVGHLVIPESLGGCPVKAIGYEAFFHDCRITSVTIPSSITYFGRWVFGVLDAVFIDDLAAWCNIEFETITANPLWSACAFFVDGKEVTDLVIPDGVTQIKNWAFAMEIHTFNSVRIPDSVTRIAKDAFVSDTWDWDCEHLFDTTTIPGVYLLDGWVVGFEWKCSVCDLTNTRGIRDGAAYDNMWLSSVKLPGTWKKIGAWAFFNCNKLESITIPDGIRSIEDRAFEGCTNLTSVTIGNMVTNIGDWAFYNCHELKQLVLPASVAHIGWHALDLCWGMESLYVPSAWDGTDMLKDAWGEYGPPPTLKIVYYGGESTETTTTPVSVPHGWLQESAADILAACGGDHEAAAKAPAANGRPVWECYVADVSATDAAENFKTVLVQENGQWVAKPSPDRGDARTYTVQGASGLGGEEAWGPVTDDSRFFRVKVALPE